MECPEVERPRLFCLDLEGILLSEFWIEVAKRFRVPALRRTTRDEPDYGKLMRYRLRLLRKEGIRLREIQRVIAGVEPLPGARAFLQKLRAAGPVVILSDTYYEFAGPVLPKLGSPTLFCNRLTAGRDGFIRGYRLRQKDGKRRAVLGLKRLGFHVKAVGDSFNDLAMLKAADEGFLFNPPASIRKKRLRFPVARSYGRLLKLLLK